jgi:steroid delta-isomerase-like uncharacterized protein
MSAQDSANLVAILYQGFNDRSFEQVASIYTDDCEYTNVPAGMTLRGHEGVLQSLHGWAAAFPDSKLEVHNVIATDDLVAVEFTGRGTHSGPLATPAGMIPATGRPLELRLVEVHQLRGGKISATRTYYDAMSMMQQLGLVPAMG